MVDMVDVSDVFLFLFLIQLYIVQPNSLSPPSPHRASRGVAP